MHTIVIGRTFVSSNSEAIKQRTKNKGYEKVIQSERQNNRNKNVCNKEGGTKHYGQKGRQGIGFFLCAPILCININYDKRAVKTKI